MNVLNDLAESLAMVLNKQEDVVFKEKLKFDIKSWRSTFLQQDSERNVIDNRAVQSFCMDLSVVDMSECCDVSTGCKILRTTQKVPVPVRLKNNSPFLFVGNLINKGYSFSKREDWDLETYRRFNKKTPIYDYYNDYIYIKNGGVQEFLLIKSVFENPEDLKKCCSTTTNLVYNLDTFPLSLGMAARIKDAILKVEMRGYQGEDKEVKVDEELVKK